MQKSKAQNVKVVPSTGSTPDLKRTTLDETVAESVADELLVVQSSTSNKNGPIGSSEQQKDPKGVKAGNSSLEEKKVSRPQKIVEFHNIKISQVVISFVPFDEVAIC
jgi:hypothetical protein